MLEKIKNLLGEELATQVEAKLGDVELGISNDGTLVPAEKHDNMKAEFKATKEQLDKLQDDIKSFQGSESTIEELKAQLKAKGEEFEAFKSDTENREIKRTKVNAMTKALESAGALKSSIDLLIPTIDTDKVQLDKSGNIVDLDDIINPIKEARKELFTVEKPVDNPPVKGKPNTEYDSDQSFFDAMMNKKGQ